MVAGVVGDAALVDRGSGLHDYQFGLDLTTLQLSFIMRGLSANNEDCAQVLQVLGQSGSCIVSSCSFSHIITWRAVL